MKIAFVIVNYKHPENTLSIVSDLEKNHLPEDVDLKIFVVDNGREKTLGTDLSKFKHAQYVLSPGNIGFSGGNNLGLKKALADKADIVALINDDTIAPRDLIENILSSPISNPEVGAVGGKILFAKGFEYEKGYKDSEKGKVIWYAGGELDWKNIYAKHIGVNEVDTGQYDSLVDTDFVTGCLLFTRRDVLEKVGLLDNRYCLYFEDSDLGERMRRAGYRLVYDPKLVISHKVAQSSGIGSSLNDYFLTRNRLLFGMKFASLRTKLALLREAVKMLFIGTDAQKQAIRDFFSFRFGGGSWIPEAKPDIAL